MKALSLKQPWASLIALGRKTIETRTWRTDYAGPLLICASKTVDAVAAQDFPEALSQPRGVAVAVCRLRGCTLMQERHEAAACCRTYPRAQAWLLEDIRPITPFPVRGRLGLFDVELPADFSVEEMEQMAEGKAGVEQDVEKEEAEQRSPLIPDELARDIFHARRDVRQRRVEHEAAKEKAAERRKELDQAQAHLLELIDEAESGQSRLFVGVAEDDGESEE